MSISPDRENSLRNPEEEAKKQEKLRDVTLLLEQLVEREETTLKLVFDSLFDIGLINIINKKITNRHLNKFLKAIGKKPKPVARIIAVRWLKNNLPILLTQWLEEQVSFIDPPTNSPEKLPDRINKIDLED